MGVGVESLLYVPRDPATSLIIVLYSRLVFSVCLCVVGFRWLDFTRLLS